MTDLKPCPFCGGDMSSFAGMHPAAFAKGRNSFAVECDCEAIGPFKSSMEDAVEAWNTRALFDQPRPRADGADARTVAKEGIGK